MYLIKCHTDFKAHQPTKSSDMSVLQVTNSLTHSGMDYIRIHNSQLPKEYRENIDM